MANTFLTPVQGLQDALGHCMLVVHMQTCRQNTHTYKISQEETNLPKQTKGNQQHTQLITVSIGGGEAPVKEQRTVWILPGCVKIKTDKTLQL